MSTKSSRIIRYALCGLFLWFGLQQLINPSAWTGFLPGFTGYFPIPGEMFVRLNGWFEVVFAVLLLVGFQTRVVAALLGVHLLGIALSVGGAIGVRDLTLALITLSLALTPPDAWTVDHRLTRDQV